MNAKKITPLFVVEHIEPCLPEWEALGYEVTVRVPDQGPLGFVILSGKLGELMLQTKQSLASDLPSVFKRKPSALLYADVTSLAEAKKALSGAEVLVAQRKTFYGATEAWLELEGRVILGLAEH
jgi:hypothetical protein